ncbi:pyridoxal phosphate-dependent transferase [Macrophomina phaseolina]|uniref:Pyridoxal phosphate-dependent transferase n=1 Tax=Macrophomina phaseolina TaxID=35725 RepID=A0ABQ8G4N6_9PEZI|nr:pyridoxal phosphate-dependent transferase [Macrophomina phaseolina]
MATKPLINLLRGWPNTSLLPTAAIKHAADTVLTRSDIAFPGLLYGPDPGDPGARKSIAAWLTDFYHPSEPVTDERITITGGASQNLGCILQVFSDPISTRNIWISSPAYFLSFRIFEDAGFAGKLRSVPEDDDGIDVAFLRREITKSEEKAREGGHAKPTLKPARPWRKIYRHLIYVVPSFANPSSVTMPLERRKELVKLARDYDALIVCDDVYDFLHWPAASDSDPSGLNKAPLPRIVDIDRFLDGGSEREGADGFGNVASNGSFSKIAGPGLRTGWVEGTTKLAYGISQAGTSRSGGAPSQLTSTYVSQLIESGRLQTHIAGTLRPAYAARYRAMMAAIEEHLVPLGVKLPQPGREVAGGYFVWLSLPPPLKGAEVARVAMEQENLIVAEGELFEVPGDSAEVNFPCDIRLCFSWEDVDRLGEGIERLGRVIRQLQRGDKTADQDKPAGMLPETGADQTGKLGQSGAAGYW